MAERRVGMDDIIEKITDIGQKLELHIVADAETGRKTAEMYKVLVTGNGVPSLQDRTRRMEEWIAGEQKIVWTLVLLVISDIAVRFLIP